MYVIVKLGKMCKKKKKIVKKSENKIIVKIIEYIVCLLCFLFVYRDLCVELFFILIYFKFSEFFFFFRFISVVFKEGENVLVDIDFI